MKTGLAARRVFSRRRNLHKKKKLCYWKTLIHSGTVVGNSPIQSEALINIRDRKGIVFRQELLEEMKRVQVTMVRGKG